MIKYSQKPDKSSKSITSAMAVTKPAIGPDSSEATATDPDGSDETSTD